MSPHNNLFWQLVGDKGNCIHYKVSEKTYPFLIINGTTVEVWEWIGNFILYFIGYAITYPWWN